MGKPFSAMTLTERLVNRARLDAGYPADWVEPVVVQDGQRKPDDAAKPMRDEAA